jgi:hypothetical protein
LRFSQAMHVKGKAKNIDEAKNKLKEETYLYNIAINVLYKSLHLYRRLNHNNNYLLNIANVLAQIAVIKGIILETYDAYVY